MHGAIGTITEQVPNEVSLRSKTSGSRRNSGEVSTFGTSKQASKQNT